MLCEDDIRLICGLHGWRVTLHRLHPDNAVYSVIIYWQRREHTLGLLGELQQMSIEEFRTFLLTYAEETTP